MRLATRQAHDILSGSFQVEYEADLSYDGEVRAKNLPISAPSLSWDGSADVEGTGSCEVLWTDDHGTFLAPQDPTDWLTPFGAQLTIYCVISAASFVERIPLGVFVITSVPKADDNPYRFGVTRINIGSRVQLQFADRMVEVQADRFTQLSQPSQRASVYTELVALTGFQLTRTLPDAAITRNVVYEESRIKAIQALAEIAGGIPFMESDGTLSLRTIAPGPVVTALSVGETGTVVEVGAALSRDQVYNGVVIRGETDEQQAILAEKWITTGPLRATQPGQPRTPFHRAPKFYSSPFITTQAQAAAAVDGLLARYAGYTASQLEITCVVNPLLQVGDVVTVKDRSENVWTVRLSKLSFGGGGTMRLTGDVISRVRS